MAETNAEICDRIMQLDYTRSSLLGFADAPPRHASRVVRGITVGAETITPRGFDLAGNSIVWGGVGRVVQPDVPEEDGAQLLPIVADLESFAQRELGASAAVETQFEDDALTLVVRHDANGIAVDHLAAIAKLITDWFVEILPEALWGRVFIDFRSR